MSELITGHKIYYSNKNVLSVGEVASSLIALEQLFHSSPQVIETLFPEVKIDSTKVFIQKIESGSLIEDVFVRFFFGNQEGLDAFIAGARKVTGMEKIQKNPKLLSLLLLALILSGGGYALTKTPSNSAQKEQLESNQKSVVEQLAKELELSPEEVNSAISAGIKSKKELAKNSIKFVLPAKKEAGTVITFDESPDISISKETISMFPSYIPDDADEETLKDYIGTKIIIRATDLDNLKKGWAVVVPEIGEKRIVLQLDDNINPSFLAKHEVIFGDITVLFRADDNGVSIPKRVYLRAITGEKQLTK